MARTDCVGVHHAGIDPSDDRPADRGPTSAHPVAGGADGRPSRIRCAADRKMASMSANSATTSGCASSWVSGCVAEVALSSGVASATHSDCPDPVRVSI